MKTYTGSWLVSWAWERTYQVPAVVGLDAHGRALLPGQAPERCQPDHPGRRLRRGHGGLGSGGQRPSALHVVGLLVVLIISRLPAVLPPHRRHLQLPAIAALVARLRRRLGRREVLQQQHLRLLASS